MKKKFTLITIFILLLISVVACSGQDNPEKVVSEYVDAMKNFDFELMASKINPNDKEAKEEVSSLYEEGQDSMEKYFIEYVEANAKKITYKINQSKIDGDKAVVSVDFKYVDGAPLFKATFREYMKEAFSLAFTEGELTDEEYSEMFIAAMEKENKSIEETFMEKTLDINCIKVDGEWYIDEPDEEILDIAMSNMMSAIDEIDESFDFEDDEEPAIDIEEIEEEKNLIEKAIGEEAELKTLNLKVTKVEESKKLTSEYYEDVLAKEATKFVLVSMDAVNLTKTEISFPDDLKLIDNQDREFSIYSESIGAIDDYLEYKDLAPSIKESGRLVYQVPEDSTNYYILVGKEGTDDVYKFILK